MEKYRNAGRIVNLRPCPAAGRLVTSSLQERQGLNVLLPQQHFFVLHSVQKTNSLPRLYGAATVLFGSKYIGGPGFFSMSLINLELQ